MSAFTARATGAAPAPAGRIPYVYGAAHGAPSRGRPEKVLAHLKAVTGIQQQEESAADGRGGGAAAAGGRRRRLEFLAAEALGAGIIAAAEAARLAALEQELAARGVIAPEVVAPEAARRCRSCGYLTSAPAHRIECGDDR
jgi:hypothetical protein